jgi:hypothetical protein
VHAAPPTPQVASDGGELHVVPEQHPATHVAAHWAQTPLLQACPPQSSQSWPPVPHWALDWAVTHEPPGVGASAVQHPVGHEVASQTH